MLYLYGLRRAMRTEKRTSIQNENISFQQNLNNQHFPRSNTIQAPSAIRPRQLRWFNDILLETLREALHMIKMNTCMTK